MPVAWIKRGWYSMAVLSLLDGTNEGAEAVIEKLLPIYDARLVTTERMGLNDPTVATTTPPA
jgi:hypothetical protein